MTASLTLIISTFTHFLSLLHQKPNKKMSHIEAEEEVEQTPWPELLGSNNWQGLIAPSLRLSLRKLILQCGDLCQATYDAFNNDQNSRFCGTSRYGKKQFFKKVMNLELASNFEVVEFLYATAKVSVPQALLLRSHSREMWDRESNWIGYVAVRNDEGFEKLGRRDVFVAWRGTTRNYEWVNVFGAELQSLNPLLRTKVISSTSKRGDTTSSSSDEDDNEKLPKVMQGWLTIYTSDDPNSPFTKTSVRTQLLTIIQNLLHRYKDQNLSITFTGHSLGACLSILSAFDIAENINNISNIPISAIVFGSPQVGNKAFDEKLKKFTNVHVLHIRNTIDVIPHYPSKLLGYVYTGTELVIDTRKSPSLKDSKNPSDWHNLQAMLHIIAGWNGENGAFELKVKRSLALVNKSCEYLKDECLVPGIWWVEKNRGMVLDGNGDWILDQPDDEDLPVPPEHHLISN